MPKQSKKPDQLPVELRAVERKLTRGALVRQRAESFFNIYYIQEIIFVLRL